MKKKEKIVSTEFSIRVDTRYVQGIGGGAGSIETCVFVDSVGSETFRKNKIVGKCYNWDDAERVHEVMANQINWILRILIFNFFEKRKI